MLDDVAEGEAEADGEHGPLGAADDALPHAEDDPLAPQVQYPGGWTGWKITYQVFESFEDNAA